MRKILLFLTLCLPVLLIAQVDLEISVVYLDNGDVGQEINVILENKAIGYRAARTTNDLGKVTFTGLSTSGTYTAFVQATDVFYEARAEEISLRSNAKGSANIGLARKASYEVGEVVIGASTTKINTVNAEVASSLSREEIELLPTEGRDITRLLFRLPNVSQATGFYPEAPNVAINGANSLYTNYMIDGLDNNERFLGGQKFRIPVGFVQDITVLTNNFSAEFGNTANGVINLTTRSGSNETHGEVFAVTRPGPAIDGESPFAQRDLSGNQVKNGFQRYQGGFALGGALNPNKTFYFINAEQIIDLKDNLLNVPDLGVNETVRGANRFTLLSGKIDHNWSQKFRTSVRVNTGLVNIDRQGGGLEGGTTFPSGGNSQDRNSFLGSVKNVYVGTNFSSETNIQYSRFRWNYGKPDNPESPQVAVLGPDDQTLAVLGHPGYVFDARENTVQFQQKFTFNLGRHTLKTGAEVISANHQLFGGGNRNGNYTVKLTNEQLSDLRNKNLGSNLGVNDIPSSVEVLNYNIELRPAEIGKTQNIFSLYVEDQVAVSNRLNVNLGFRYDYDNLSKGGSAQGDLNNIAPRASFNWRVTDVSSIRGGVGVYYDKVLYAIYSDALQQNTTSADYRAQLQALIDGGQLPADTDLDAITFDGNLSASAAGVPYLNGPSFESLQGQRDQAFSNDRRILSPFGYDNPYAIQMALGYQHQISSKFVAYVDFMYNESFNLYRLYNANAAAPYPITDPDDVEVRTVEEADLTRPVAIQAGGFAIVDGDTLRGVARNVVYSDPGGRSRYLAATVNLQKDKGDDFYAFRLIYTLSRLENNTEDINFRAMDGNDFEAEWGPSINDRRHIINGFVDLYLLDNFSLSIAALLQSGQPINYIPDVTALGVNGLPLGTTDLNGDGRAFGDAYVGNSDRYPGASRNEGRLPWAETVDLGAQYALSLGGNALYIRADVFNVLNTANLSGYSNNATQSNQIQVGPPGSQIVRRNASAPRQFQFSLNYVF